MASEFVEPKVVRIPLSGDGRWVDVKRELTSGEHDEMMASICLEGKETPDGRPFQNFRKTQSYQIIAYVVGWSFTNSDGSPVPVSPAAIENLKVRTRDELRRVIAQHDADSAAEVAARKNDLGDVRESPPSLVSVAP